MLDALEASGHADNTIIIYTSLELFADAGQIVLTDLIFPQAPLIELATFAEGDDIGINELIVRELQSQK